MPLETKPFRSISGVPLLLIVLPTDAKKPNGNYRNVTSLGLAKEFIGGKHHVSGQDSHLP